MNNSKIKDDFLNILESKMNDFEIIHKNFDKGDFGSLYQIEFNSEKIGGNIGFWGQQWLGIFIWDYKNSTEKMNVLLSPSDNKLETYKNAKEILLNSI